MKGIRVNRLKFKVMLSLYKDYGLEYERIVEERKGKKNVMYVYCKNDRNKLLAVVDYYEDVSGELVMIVNREMEKRSI